jgi:hypothetical protein
MTLAVLAGPLAVAWWAIWLDGAGQRPFCATHHREWWSKRLT